MSKLQNNLGLMYYQGKGVSQDYAKAMAWITKAANQGDYIAQYQLAQMYEHGKGVTQNLQIAKDYFKKVCDTMLSKDMVIEYIGCKDYQRLKQKLK